MEKVNQANEAQIQKWFGIYVNGNVPALVLEAPCGHRVEYRDFADVPREDVPCPCGDPNHWIIKYEDKTVDQPTNGTLTPDVPAPTMPKAEAPSTPEEAMNQVGELLTRLGYDGLAVIVTSPKFGTPINPYEFIPNGWELRIVPVKERVT